MYINWIPVADKLPNQDQTVIVKDEKGDIGIAIFSGYKDDPINPIYWKPMYCGHYIYDSFFSPVPIVIEWCSMPSAKKYRIPMRHFQSHPESSDLSD
jgi:hypothetical protein